MRARWPALIAVLVVLPLSGCVESLKPGATRTLAGLVAVTETVDGGSLAITGPVIVPAGVSLRLVNARVTGSGDQPDVFVRPGGFLHAVNSTLLGIRLVVEGGGLLDGVTLSASAGPLRVPGGNLRVRSAQLSGAPGPLAIVDAGALTLEDSALREAGTVALRATGGARIGLLNVTIEGAGQHGLLAENATLTVDRSRFFGTPRAVEVSASETAPARFSNTTFEGATEFALKNTGRARVDARWNWWGSPEGPGGSALGPADVEPWLDAPPS